jgi:hypothetical protein
MANNMRPIAAKKGIYPLCCNADCSRITHLTELTKDDYLIKQGCIGHIYFVNERQAFGRPNVREKYLYDELECLCDIPCKKCYFHEYTTLPITSADDLRLPFNMPNEKAPETDPIGNVTNKNVAMRFTVEQAKELCMCKGRYFKHEISSITDQKIRDAFEEWRTCWITQSEGTYVKKSNIFLKVPKESYLFSIAKEVKLADLVWRANGHSIEDGTKVYTTCGFDNCCRYEHLVAETYEEHLTRSSCSNILCFMDNQLNSVITCKHEIKCRKTR